MMSLKKMPELVFVPGMFSTGTVFQGIKNDFEVSGRRCRIIDFPGNLDFCEKVEFLLKELAKINGDYQLVGHSAGAILVLKVAAMDEVNPKNIFLIAPAAPYGLFNLYPSVVKSFWCVMQDPSFMTKMITMSFSDMRRAMFQTLSIEKAKSIYELTRAESGKFIFEVGFWFLDSNKSTLVDYCKIRSPIDIFIGTADRVTPLCVSRGIVKRIKLVDSTEQFQEREIRLHELSGLSHWLLIEAREKIVSLIEDYRYA